MESVGEENIDWDAFFQSVPESVDLFADGLDTDLSPQISPGESPKGTSNSSPISTISISSWIDDLEQFLLDEDNHEMAESQDFCENFFSDIVPDSGADGNAPAVDGIVEENSAADEEEEKEKSGVSDEDGASKGEIQSQELEKQNLSVSDGRQRIREEEDEEDDERSTKKLKRQLRNRDSAMKSRERKKLYVRDLELKSRFLEGECKRLEYALRCSLAENQILYQRLEKEKGLGASVTKQESAVLKESLPLGSLLWLISIILFFLLPGLKLTVATLSAGRQRGTKGQEVVMEVRQGKRNEGSSRIRQGLVHMRRRCKATRTKMKSLCLLPVFG